MKLIHILYTVLSVLAVVALTYVSVLYPVIPIIGAILFSAMCTGIYFSPKVGWLGNLFLPKVVADTTSFTGYGMRKRPTALLWLSSLAIILDGVICGIVYQISKKEYTWLIRPVRTTVNIRSGIEWQSNKAQYSFTDGTTSEPNSSWKTLYLTERAALAVELIRRAGWRAVFFRAIVELPKTAPDKDLRQQVEFVIY